MRSLILLLLATPTHPKKRSAFLRICLTIVLQKRGFLFFFLHTGWLVVHIYTDIFISIYGIAKEVAINRTGSTCRAISFPFARFGKREEKNEHEMSWGRRMKMQNTVFPESVLSFVQREHTGHRGRDEGQAVLPGSSPRPATLGGKYISSRR
uniref:Uncharacterized protein n=1 Tax=Ixodes ricinus TaxID=34613 RepID=A0A6B0UWZ3_IXORI